ncbi:MAG: hypothetical protein AB8B44_02760 [Prochlorococcus sp.]
MEVCSGKRQQGLHSSNEWSLAKRTCDLREALDADRHLIGRINSLNKGQHHQGKWTESCRRCSCLQA